jgi:hypothetical protein
LLGAAIVIPTLDSLSQLFAAGLSSLQVRELCEAVVGIKLSRLNLEDSQIEAIRPWCEEHHLSIAVTDYLVQGNVVDEGKGNWSNIGRRFAAHGVRFAYVSLDIEETRQALESERRSDFSPLVLGRLLKIPACCTEFFISRKSEAERCFFDEYAYLTSRETNARARYDWRMNYLSQYFGHSLHGHYVCRWDCPETLRRVERAELLVRTISPVWHQAFRRAMRGVTILDGRGAVHFVRAVPDSYGWVDSSAGQVLSTMATEVAAAIRQAGGFRLRELLDVEIPGLNSVSSISPLCAIPFCAGE